MYWGFWATFVHSRALGHQSRIREDTGIHAIAVSLHVAWPIEMRTTKYLADVAGRCWHSSRKKVATMH
jgi:hypothetical protein